jgi:bifunctional pyridoxal-dependent enzyme with beta-cystathionase and maltose regulon repressor activities
VLRLLVQPGDRVVINPPVHDSYFPWMLEVGCQLVEVPLGRTGDGWALDLAGLEAAFRDGARVHLLCSPHNPTGTVHRRKDLERLAALAVRYDVTVLSDEIHAPLVLPGTTHHPFLSVSPEAAASGMLFTSASKAWNLAGLKCAAIVTTGPRRPATWPGRTAPHWGLGDDPSATFLQRGRVALSSGPSFGHPGLGHARLNMGTSRRILAAAVDHMAARSTSDRSCRGRGRVLGLWWAAGSAVRSPGPRGGGIDGGERPDLRTGHGHPGAAHRRQGALTGGGG